MYCLSVSADTVFLALPFVERAKRIASCGFLVEFWNWAGRDIDALAQDPDIRISAFTGYTKGSMLHPDGIAAFIAGVRASVEVAKQLRCRSLFLSPGELDSNGQVSHKIANHPATRWISAYKTLCQIAELAEKEDVVYNLEHLNTKVDHPGFAFSRVEDAMNLLEQVGSARIKLLLDVYHTQVEEGNLVSIIRQCRNHIGHVHIADVPGRHEPGTGEINYQRIASTFREIEYDGVIGLEAYPKDDAMQAIKRFREVFACD
jgi:hydroxypyruvate isomerase